MQIMVKHIPRFFELHKSVKIFTGQGVEKNNDMARGIILHKSNKWDSAGDVLQQERHQWELKEHETEVRNCTKRKESYWDIEIKEARKQAKNHLTEHLQQPSEAQNEQPPTQSTSSDTDFSKMTVKELKNELKQRNTKGFSQKNKAELIKQLEEIYKQDQQTASKQSVHSFYILF